MSIEMSLCLTGNSQTAVTSKQLDRPSIISDKRPSARAGIIMKKMRDSLNSGVESSCIYRMLTKQENVP